MHAHIKLNRLIQEMAAAIRAGDQLPRMPPDLSIDQAYETQKAVVAAVSGGAVAGLKAGMTAVAMQKQFGLSGAIVGCLYDSGRMDSGATIESSPGVMIECELGVVIDARGNPKSCGPVVEVPRIRFAQDEDRTGANLIACNIASDRFIVGSQQPMRASYEDTEVRLERNGETLASAPATDALGGPHQALAWMLEEAKVRGLSLGDDMLCITGACGGMHPALPGRYLVDYGDLGTIEFAFT